MAYQPTGRPRGRPPALRVTEENAWSPADIPRGTTRQASEPAPAIHQAAANGATDDDDFLPLQDPDPLDQGLDDAPAARPVRPVARKASTTVTIYPPKLRTLLIPILGNAPLCVHAFSSEQRGVIRAKHVAGSQAEKGTARQPRKFDEQWLAARHLFADQTTDGFAASSIRNAAISACRLVGFAMTRAKLSIFTVADGENYLDHTPLIKIIGGVPEKYEAMCRNATGVVDIRIRPLWPAYRWGANLKIRFDVDQFSNEDIINLLIRVGMQIGVGEGRPDSKKSAGIGFGTFDLLPHGMTVEEAIASNWRPDEARYAA